MKPTLYGGKFVPEGTIQRVSSEVVNVKALIQTFEANQDKVIPTNWEILYGKVAGIYRIMFTEGELPLEMVRSTDQQVLEMAEECIYEELDDAMFKPKRTDGRNFYYEFARSFGVEEEASQLEEFLDDECDFI